MPRCNKAKAWIEVDEVALPEFMVEIDEEKRIAHCYVPSEMGKEFVVHWSWGLHYNHNRGSSCAITVDGRMSRRSQSEPGEHSHAIHNMLVSEQGGKGFLAKLKFGGVRTTDDESISLQDEKLVKALGSIEIEVRTGVLQRVFRHRLPSAFRRSFPVRRGDLVMAPAADPAVPEPEPVHERMKKAASHQVVLGEVSPHEFSNYTFLEDQSNPVRFIFYYRAKDILLAQGIMPPVQRPPLVPTGGRRGIVPVQKVITKQESEDGAVVEDEDERRLRALEEEAAAIKGRLKKRKSDEHDGPAFKRIKTEEIQPRVPFRKGEIIDLCDD